MSVAKALLLAAGLGTRLRPLTDSMPKCLAPVCGRPILDYWLDLLGDASVRDVIVNTHTFPDDVRAYCSGVSGRGCLHIAETYERELLGSAGTITANVDFADGADHIIIIYADNLSDVNLADMLAFHKGHDDPLTMLLFHAEKPEACGIAELDGSDKVVSFVEKPQKPKSDLANAGIYVVDAEAYREMGEMGAFDIGFDVLPKFVGRMRGWVHDGYHRDIGTLEAYEQSQTDAKALLEKRGFDSDGFRPAIFLDRDGTIIEQVHYLSDPADVRLIPGAADVLRRFRESGYCSVVVSNQSAVAKGIIDEVQLARINDEMCRQLASEGAVLDAIYSCPIAPRGKDRTVVEHPERKPGPGMLGRAARELRLRIGDSWMVGDMISDVVAGINAGCRGNIFVECGKGLSPEEESLDIEFVRVADINEAAIHIFEHCG